MDSRDKDQTESKSHISCRSVPRSKGSAVFTHKEESSRMNVESRIQPKWYDGKKVPSPIEHLTHDDKNTTSSIISSIDRRKKYRSQSPKCSTQERVPASYVCKSSNSIKHVINQTDVSSRDSIHASSNPDVGSNGITLYKTIDRQSPSSATQTTMNYRAYSAPCTRNSSRSFLSPQHVNSFQQIPPKIEETPIQPDDQVIVTPELLVDALSGHEDGLLAIAERLMSHYDSGYDTMGEAIIDAFADVQKLFQHVVEAAHMEGAAHEAGRRDVEISRLKKIVEDNCCEVTTAELLTDSLGDDIKVYGKNNTRNNIDNDEESTSVPTRHDEFIDEDVRDILYNALRKGRALIDQGKQVECYALYDKSCHSASALLPVDSDHRGRLQLSIARAESMSPERACVILKYVMDDVLRSGLNPNTKIIMPDPSQRGDCVLARPAIKSRLDDFSISDGSNFHEKISSSSNVMVVNGRVEKSSENSHINTLSSSIDLNANDSATGVGTVLQSSEEALASLVEEMKEVLDAPVYKSTPLQDVAGRFWTALAGAQRNGQRNEERLEQKLGTIKAEFLLAREEWEEKSNTLVEENMNYKRKLGKLKVKNYTEITKEGLCEKSSYYNGEEFDRFAVKDSKGNLHSHHMKTSSAASFGSLAHHARTIVGSLSCMGMDNSVPYMGAREKHSKTNGSKGRTSFRDRDSSPPYIFSSSVSQSKASSRMTSQSSNEYCTSRITNRRKSRSNN